jgi:hypothetical protein
MNRIVAIFLLTVSIPAFSQNTKESVDPFTKIDVFGPFEVELIKSDKNGYTIDYRGYDAENIIREVNRGQLKLKLRNKHYFNEWTNDYPRSRYIKVKVYYTDLQEVRAQAGAIVSAQEVLKSKNLSLHGGMGAEMNLAILSKNLYTKVTMGATVELEGRVENLDVKASMGGLLKASRLESKTAYIDATMGADVDVRALDEIEISAGFGAVVNYTGGPTVRHANKNFGAEVRGN